MFSSAWRAWATKSLVWKRHWLSQPICPPMAAVANAIANATGLEAPDDGLAFPPGSVNDIPTLMRLKSEGGHLAKKGVVEVISSLPHYTAEATDRQRGQGTFDASVRAMRALNEVGYGRGHPTRGLTLVHNPVGAFLPGGQAQLERDFRRVLEGAHGVTVPLGHSSLVVSEEVYQKVLWALRKEDAPR